MTASFAQQIARIRQAKAETLLSDEAAQELIIQKMQSYLAGKRNDRQIRFDLERVIRDAYRDNMRSAMLTARWQAGRNKRWAPIPKDKLSPALKQLVADVQRNLREYKDSDQDEKALRKAVLRFRLSATTAAQKGFSDGQRLAFLALQEEGEEVRKIWAANYTDNTPCDICHDLHGLEVPLHVEFPHAHKVYGDLFGPPAHPVCRCDALYLIVSDDNRNEEVVIPHEYEPRMISSTRIKAMPLALFQAVIGAIARGLDLLRKAVGK